MTFNNKWVRAAIPALLIHCSIGTVYCWSSFSEELALEIGAKTGTIGWAFSLAIFFLGMSAAYGGNFVEKDINKSSLISTIFFTLGMLGTGLFIQLSDSLGTTLTTIGIFLCYGVIMGIGLGIGYLTPVKTLMLWFSENKGLATGISIMGFGLAKAIASPIMNTLQEKIGLSKMFYILGIIYFILMMIGHFLLKKPSGWTEEHKKHKIKFIDMIKNKTFLGCWLMFYINITCGLALIACEKPILNTLGLSLGTISLIQSATAGTNALGRIGFSTLSDKMKDRNTIYKIIFMLSIIVSLLGFITNSILNSFIIIAVIILLVVNAGYGGGFSTMPALLSSRFGMTNISEIHGLILSAWAIAGLSGNQLSDAIYTATNKYEFVLLAIGILYIIALLISHFMVKEKHK